MISTYDTMHYGFAQCFGNKFDDILYLLAVGTCGRIIIVWDSSIVSLSNQHVTEHTITALAKSVEGQVWWLTGVYGPQLDQQKVEFLDEIQEVRDLHAGP